MARELTSPDVARLLYYGQFVLVLSLGDNAPTIDAQSLSRIVTVMDRSAVFPRLRTMFWSMRGHHTEHLAALVPASLGELDIEMIEFEPETLSDIAHATPQLERLTLSLYSPHDSAQLGCLWEVWKVVRDLHIMLVGWDATMLTAIRSLPRLASLTLGTVGGERPRALVYPPDGAQNTTITKLRIWSIPEGTVYPPESLLEGLRPKVLSSLEVDCLNGRSAVVRFCNSVGRVCDVALLTHIDLGEHPSGPGDVGHMDDIRALFRFRCLETVKLTISVDLKDSDVEEMGDHWPRLRELWLPALENPRLTMLALWNVARSFPSLEHLTITVNAADAEWHSALTPPPRCSTLRTLDVGSSIAGTEPPLIAAQLAHLFPQLTAVAHDYGSEEDDMTQSTRWNTVIMLRPFFVQGMVMGFWGGAP